MRSWIEIADAKAAWRPAANDPRSRKEAAAPEGAKPGDVPGWGHPDCKGL